ncbi:hypothetical protein Y032_0270g851 [Ancylostoma ceylanicum]|uniref:DRBM domain-containing protein n=1 Tax=Ancylostoma ceylanicum TaxID=53326 RepID=A0A016S8J5_9BILA|nr:hypothetical protein Y032_0270g851 [Ancylostoma ceylanicum]
MEMLGSFEATSASKHPVSVVMELCAKRKWPLPTFLSHESGPPNAREFKCTAIVNGVEYKSNVVSRSKKDAKALACQRKYQMSDLSSDYYITQVILLASRPLLRVLPSFVAGRTAPFSFICSC